MSTFETGGYQWRETYFVLFNSANRPNLEAVNETLRALSPRFELVNPTSDAQGRFESITLRSPQDYAALDISYMSGEEVLEQGAGLAEEMKSSADDAKQKSELKRLKQCDARFDILHFEQVSDNAEDEDLDEMLDPSALLVALDALIDLTDGIGIDPQSGAFM